MHITTKTLWIAIHRLFLAEGVGLGASLSLKKLMDGWRDSGLRSSDLGAGLESLVDKGFVALELSATGPVARLLDEGFARLRPGSSDMQAVVVLAQLQAQRRRAPSRSAGSMNGGGEGRRAEDQLEQLAAAA